MNKPINPRIKELIQQLGEAIHDSVSESDQISGVVRDIRAEGFDVLLMLEATIGLNEVGSDESEEASAEEGDTFTKSDVSFLKSLRISLPEDPAEEPEAESKDE